MKNDILAALKLMNIDHRDPLVCLTQTTEINPPPGLVKDYQRYRGKLKGFLERVLLGFTVREGAVGSKHGPQKEEEADTQGRH